VVCARAAVGARTATGCDRVRRHFLGAGNGRLAAQSSAAIDGLVVFAATFLMTAGVYLVVTRLAVDERARAFKAVSPGMLPPLGILFALLVGFIAVEVWNNFDKAKVGLPPRPAPFVPWCCWPELFPKKRRCVFML
jgi:hypothetical protein